MRHAYCILMIALIAVCAGCRKYVQIDESMDRLPAGRVFTSDATALTAINGIYGTTRNFIYSSSYLTDYAHLYSDELINRADNDAYNRYRDNNLQATDVSWTYFYQVIYACNAAIEGMSQPGLLTEVKRRQFLGDARFFRAFCYFYLVNVFGDVPLAVKTDIKTNIKLRRNKASDVWKVIINDLKDARQLLTATPDNNVRVNHWTATALLARAYLYNEDWENALKMSDSVIAEGPYMLQNDPSNVKAADHPEAILQFANNNTDGVLGASMNTPAFVPAYVLRQSQIQAFEAGDRRWNAWIRSYTSGSMQFYYVNRFNVVNPRYTPLGLAEQYLIRAEAAAHLNMEEQALASLNAVRTLHGGLPEITGLSEPGEIVNYILRERRVELLAEECHRWFDLRRTGRLNAVMQQEKGNLWKATAAYWPIPLADIQRSPGLEQNPGYE